MHTRYASSRIVPVELLELHNDHAAPAKGVLIDGMQPDLIRI